MIGPKEVSEDFIKAILQRAKSISKSEGTFKLIKKLKQAVDTLAARQGVPIEALVSQLPTQHLIVYHYGQGLQLDLTVIKTAQPFNHTEVILKTGCPYGLIRFASQLQNTQFMDSCLTIDGSQIHYLELQFGQSSRIVFYLYSLVSEFEGNGNAQIEDCERQYQGRVPGLQIINDFLTQSQQQLLVQHIDKQKWARLNNRKVQHYGYQFKYGKNAIDRHQVIQPIPQFFNSLLDRLKELELVEHGFDQLTINCYDPGDGIPSHFDTHSPFEQVFVSISLLGDIVMEFQSFRKETQQVLLRGSSLAVFRGEARFAWMHGITGRQVDKVDGCLVYRKRRISLTFRKIKFDPCHCKYYFYCDSQGYDQATMKRTNPLLLKYLSHQNVVQVDSSTEKTFVSDVYHQVGHTFSNPIHPIVSEFIRQLPEQSLVLDVGCGNGNYMRLVEKHRCTVIGMQKCVNMKGDPGEQRVYGNAVTLPFRSGVFDSVLMVAVYHHLSTYARRLASLLQIERVLQVGGRCIISVWSYQHKRDVYQTQQILLDYTLPKHRSKGGEKDQTFKRYYHLFRREELLDLVAQSGLRLITLTEQFDNYYVVVQREK